MKLNRIILPLALVAALAATGCKHGFNGKVTDLPGHRPQPVPSEPAPTLPPGPTVETPSTPFVAPTTVPPGGGALPTDLNPEDYNQDRNIFAGETVHFKFDSAVVQDSEQANVASVGQALQSDATAKLVIEGHCDERGTEEYNRALGERRALALREALAKDGIDPMRVRTESFGKDKPQDPAHDETAWAKNRRGEFIYYTPKTPIQ